MNEVAFITTVFPAVERYLEKFFLSLRGQTYGDYDLYVVNDGLKDFQAYIKKFTDLNIIEINEQGSPAKLREFGINTALNRGYDIIVFGDADDFFEQDRIERVIGLMPGHDIVVNDLTLVDEQEGIIEENYLSNRLQNNEVITIEYIKDKNIFGLSNTAVRGAFLSPFSLPDDIVAVDWYLFTLLLLKGGRAIFTNDTVSYYRQHSANTVGIGKMDGGMVLKGLNVKLQHYGELAKNYDEFKPYHEECRELTEKMRHDQAFASSYIERIKQLKIESPLWWETVRPWSELAEHGH